ncbi:hypothetical protein EI94DRAFT_1847400 [Lactarius quietus]|nr:hypothetical protein EI94DRAFT_1847400 [Lactarius quietus]
MSFLGTPLGQGRQLDHHTFLSKHNPYALQKSHILTRPLITTSVTEHSIPTSYAYSPPTFRTRSPLLHPMVRLDVWVAQQSNPTLPLRCMHKWLSKGQGMSGKSTFSPSHRLQPDKGHVDMGDGPSGSHKTGEAWCTCHFLLQGLPPLCSMWTRSCSTTAAHVLP